MKRFRFPALGFSLLALACNDHSRGNLGLSQKDDAKSSSFDLAVGVGAPAAPSRRPPGRPPPGRAYTGPGSGSNPYRVDGRLRLPMFFNHLADLADWAAAQQGPSQFGGPQGLWVRVTDRAQPIYVTNDAGRARAIGRLRAMAQAAATIESAAPGAVDRHLEPRQLQITAATRAYAIRLRVPGAIKLLTRFSARAGFYDYAVPPGQEKAEVWVDFANRYLGGGAMSYGDVQEEIMFRQAPQLARESMLRHRDGAGMTQTIEGLPSPLIYDDVHFTDSSYSRYLGRRNILAVAAPNLRETGDAPLSIAAIVGLYANSFAAFDLAVSTGKTTVNSGRLGAGAFGHNVIMSMAMQMLAARRAGVADLRFWAADDTMIAMATVVVNTIEEHLPGNDLATAATIALRRAVQPAGGAQTTLQAYLESADREIKSRPAAAAVAAPTAARPVAPGFAPPGGAARPASPGPGDPAASGAVAVYAEIGNKPWVGRPLGMLNYNAHFDWWTFPVAQPSSHGAKYQLNRRDMQRLAGDATFRGEYLSNAHEYATAFVSDKGRHPYDVRTYKMLSSLWQFYQATGDPNFLTPMRRVISSTGFAAYATRQQAAHQPIFIDGASNGFNASAPLPPELR